MKKQQQHDPIPETVTEALSLWDAGKAVFSVEMGGLGPGYEQCIQVLAFELMRAWDGKSMDEQDARQAEADAIVTKMDKTYGYSGAQVGAAKNLAACVCRRGYRAAIRDPALDDRLIQVSKEPVPAWTA